MTIRALMDDLIVTTTAVPGARWVLQGLEKLMTWARMGFKRAKSRSLVLKGGRVTDKFHFNSLKWNRGEDQIATGTEKPVKSLGKVFNCSLKDSETIKATCADVWGLVKDHGQVWAPR